MLDIAEPERTIIRLTSCEREEFARAEAEIGETLSAFLRCGAALSVIRNKRLYREKFVLFADYVRERWGMSESAAGALLTNYHIAEQLEGAGIKLPAEVTQSAMKALSRVPRLEGLRGAVWEYARGLSPGVAWPPVVLLQRITRIILEVLVKDGTWALHEDENTDGASNRVLEGSEVLESERARPIGGKRASVGDERFLRAVTRLSAYQGFSVPLIASQVQTERMAAYAFRACERLKLRLGEVEEAIVRQFPNAPTQQT